MEGSIDNPYQYASGYTDSATGLIQFGLRYYQPATGRWTQQDPLAGSLFDPSTGNRYAYVNDDPTNLTDPSGAASFNLAVTAAIQTLIAAGCSLGAVIATGTIIGIPVATLLTACGISFGFAAAVTGFAALF